MSGELGRAGSLLAIGLGASTEKQRHSQQSNLWLLRTLRRDWCMTEINSERSRPRLPLLESGPTASSCSHARVTTKPTARPVLERNGGVIVVRGLLPQQYVRHFAAAVFAPVPKLALRYSEAAFAWSSVSGAPRKTIRATVPSHSRFARFAPTARSMPWQSPQLPSTISFPGPSGKATGAGLRHVHARPEIGCEIRHHRIHLRRAYLRAAQDHVIDLVPPRLRSLTQPRECVEPVALRARDRDDVAALAVGQRIAAGDPRLLGMSERPVQHAGNEQRADCDLEQGLFMVIPCACAAPRPKAAGTIRKRRPGRRAGRVCRAGKAGLRHWRAGRVAARP